MKQASWVLWLRPQHVSRPHPSLAPKQIFWKSRWRTLPNRDQNYWDCIVSWKSHAKLVRSIRWCHMILLLTYFCLVWQDISSELEACGQNAWYPGAMLDAETYGHTSLCNLPAIAEHACWWMTRVDSLERVVAKFQRKVKFDLEWASNRWRVSDPRDGKPEPLILSIVCSCDTVCTQIPAI